MASGMVELGLDNLCCLWSLWKPPGVESGFASWLERSGSFRLPGFCVLSCSGCCIDSNSDTHTKRSRPKAKCFATSDCSVPGFADADGASPYSGCTFDHERCRPLPAVHHDALCGTLRGHCSGCCPDQD